MVIRNSESRYPALRSELALRGSDSETAESASLLASEPGPEAQDWYANLRTTQNPQPVTLYPLLPRPAGAA